MRRVAGERETDQHAAYLRIAAALRDQLSGAQPHAPVPSERELSEQFKVSRMTARRAVALLESEGTVYRRPPRGTFVAESRLILRIGSFSEEVTRLGHQPQAVLLDASTAKAGDRVGAQLGLDPHAEVHVLHRLRSVDGVPVALETTHLPGALTPGLLNHALDGSIWALLRREYGVDPVEATAKLECLPLDDRAASQLAVRPASPGIVLTRHTRNREGRCVEYAVDTYRADRTAFEVTTDVSPAAVRRAARRRG